MRYAPGLWHIILALLLLVTLAQAAEWPALIWDARLMPPARVRPGRNAKRNRERWARRLARRQRQRPPVRRAGRRRRHRRELQPLRHTGSGAGLIEPGRGGSGPALSPRGGEKRRAVPITDIPDEADPLADLRQRRGWIDRIDERELWSMLTQVRWPHGPECPHCGERDLHYLTVMDPDYRGGLGRWRCQVCAEAGDPGEGGTFTPLTGTILDGMRIDIRTLWLIMELFADGKASVETAQEAQVNGI